jgi:hypothetical protein
MVWRTLPSPHAGLGRLFGSWFVGENPNPNLAAALDVVGYSSSCSLNLSAGNPSWL